MSEGKTEIIVCKTFYEWIQFLNWVNEMNITNTKYFPLINNEYNKLMGLEKYTTKVKYIGCWYENITEDTKKFLSLFDVVYK